MRILYNFFLTVLAPLFVLRLLWKSRRNRDYRRHIGERFARALPPALPNCLWFHTVSVGEFLALKPLLAHILHQRPQQILWLSCTTPTGREQIAAFATQWPQRLRYTYLPYDLLGPMRRFLRHLQPLIAVFMETELWPNALHIAAQANIPTYLINARLSAKSLRGYRRFAPVPLAEPLRRLHASAQSRQDAKRLRTLGVPTERIVVIPSLKYVCEATPARPLFSLPKQHAWLWLAASTHHPEEIYVLEAFQRLCRDDPDACLCIAPRHPERRDSLSKSIHAMDFTPRLHSKRETWRSSEDVVILDTLGELDRACLSATVAFVGGSLNGRGGQNPLQPLQAGCAVCFGPSMANFQTIRDALIEHSFARQSSRETLAETVRALKKEMDDHGREPILAYAQAASADVLDRHYHHLLRLLRE